MNDLTELKEWRALGRHQKKIAVQSMREWFEQDTGRFDRFSMLAGEIFLDYSRNLVNDKTLSLLCKLATSIQLRQKIEALFTGELVNQTEKRPALHTALRDLSHQPVFVNGENIALCIKKSLDKMREFADAVHTGQWKIAGKSITHIVNVGIGGSHLGPKMCVHALKDFACSGLEILFVSSIDDANLNEVLNTISWESTLFIVSSKSFSTLETLTNASTLFSFMKEKAGETAAKQHFVAVTAEPVKAMGFGILEEHIFHLWDWVGGRYSIWSAIGLPLMLMIGPKQFDDFLQGANEMDHHFRHSPFEKNMPVILGLLNIWYMNFFHANMQAIVPYAHRLRYLIPYLQQAEMESNGKQVNAAGQFINYMTGPVLFGEEGCNGQHAYHQLLHQGQHFVPVDFILTNSTCETANITHQNILAASCLSQAQALMYGKTFEEAYQTLLENNYSAENAGKLAAHLVIPGNKPSNILFMHRLTPKNLGALIALYEHKIFVQSIIWDINAFDQWGVELGKQLLPSILKCVQDKKNNASIDAATANLIQYFNQIREKS